MRPGSSTSFSSASSGDPKLYGGNSKSIEGQVIEVDRNHGTLHGTGLIWVYVFCVLLIASVAQVIQELISHA